MGLPSFYVLLIATLLITLHAHLGLAQSSTPGSILTRPYFNSLISAVPSNCAGKSLYTYDAFIAATGSFPAFGTTGTDVVRKKEVAAFLANARHETQSLCYTREMNPQSNFCNSSYPQYPCAPGQSYFGRGPLQLSWNYNYGAAGQALRFNGLGNPDIVAQDGNISFKAALWFWMNSNCHNAMVSDQGFGETIRAINSGECNGGSTPKVSSRISFYRGLCQQFGVDPGPNLSC